MIAKLKADATVAGNAGSIAVWSEKSTTVRGALSARGGAAGGNGGSAAGRILFAAAFVGAICLIAIVIGAATVQYP